MIAGCQGSQPIKVALLTKLESGSLIGSSEVDAVRLYLEEKGIDNIELVPINDGWDTKQVVTAYQEARQQGIRFFLTSHTSTVALELKKLTDQEKEEVLVFVTGSTTDQLTGLDDNNIRVVQDVASEQKSIAEEISKRAYPNLLIIRDLDNNKYTEPALTYFEKYYKGKFTVIDISIKALDMTALQSQIAEVDFQGVYTLIGGNQTVSGSVAQLAWRQNQNIQVYFTPWNNATTVIETAGEAIDVCIMANHYPFKGDEPAINSYMERFKKVYDYAPTYNSLHMYRGMALLNEAIQSGAKTPVEVKTYILKQKLFKTEFGDIIIDAKGDTDMPLYFIDKIKEAF